MEAFQNLGFWGTLLVTVVLSALPLVFVLVYAIVAIYLEMKVAAHMQDRLAYMRTGWHGVLQPIADFIKLIQKEDIISIAADRKLFILAPYIVFVGT
jgi:NADH-quinone oxidoreductase subunit H